MPGTHHLRLLAGVRVTAAQDRLLGALRAIVRAEAPALDYVQVRAYVVTGSSGTGPLTLLDLAPADTSGPMPSLTGVSVRPGLLAETVTGVPAGTRARVRFLNASPTSPVVTSLLGLSQGTTVDATGTLAVGPGAAQVLLGGGSAPVARGGDMITAYLPLGPVNVSGLVQSASPSIVNGLYVGTMEFADPEAIGIVQSGNPRVTA